MREDQLLLLLLKTVRIVDGHDHIQNFKTIETNQQSETFHLLSRLIKSESVRESVEEINQLCYCYCYCYSYCYCWKLFKLSARPLRRSTSFPSSSFKPSLESSLAMISFNEEIWFSVPSCKRLRSFAELDGSAISVDSVECEVVCINPENCSLWPFSVVPSVENVGTVSLESGIGEDEINNEGEKLSLGVDEEPVGDVEEEAEHVKEALSSGSVRKQYSSWKESSARW